MIDRDDRQSEERRAGLCATCRHARIIPHPRGGEPYYRCALSETDSRFPRFPGLPVHRCPGYD